MRIGSYPSLRFYALLPRAIRAATNILILALWLWLYRPVLDYFCVIFTEDDFRTNQVLLLGVLGLIAYRIQRGGWRLRLNAAPWLHPPALALALGGSTLYLLAERFLDVNTLSATLFGLASYGLLGLWLTPDSIPAWRKGLPVALLLIGTLPFGDHLQTFVGYPLRILTARLVSEGLAAAGVPSVGVDTILVLENGVSKVDLPCSGIKSLWSGALFLLAVTWIEGCSLNRRWLLTAFLFGGLLFVVNLLRVAVLVVVGQVLGWWLMAEMLHVPLGVLGFVAACAAFLSASGILAAETPPTAVAAAAETPPTDGRGWDKIAIRRNLVVAAVLVAMILSYAPRPQTGLAQMPPTWEFPPELHTRPQALTPDEVTWLTRDGAESAERLRFEWRGLHGSLILITSRTWRAHHRPERCFEVYGLSLDDSRPILITPTFPARFVALGQNGSSLFSATYWFQSAEQRFPYRVAPRGAAQEVYRLQVQRRIDPALVEQIGPRQYRLRAFPVEPRNIRWDADTQRSTVQEGAMLHLWLTCRVLAQGDTWPLPQLAERRNVYWDRETVRLVNGKPMAAEGDEWLPASVPATSAVTPALHRVDFPGGRTVLVRPAVSNDRPPLPASLRLAVVLDRSRSMAGHAAEVRAALTRLASLDATVEVYLIASAYRGEGPSRLPLAELNADDILYFGGQNAAELLAQFEALRGHDPYEAVLILTDDSGYELSAEGVEVPAFPAAVGEVWMVHLGGRFPLGYDDATLAAIQAGGGGVAGSLEEALARLAAGLAGADDVIDGYVWQTLPTAEAQGKVEADFGPLAARHLILAEMERQRGALDQLTTLDALHAIAVEQSIVTPYSSMIVLVNQGQEAQLEQLEGQDDRFQREHEEVGETLPPNTLDVAGVPEPEEWLLLALAAAMLLAWVRKEARGRRQEA